MTHNPFLVPCPDCTAPAGQRCRIGNQRITNDDGTAVHRNRVEGARLRTAVHGTCTRCGRLMLQMVDPDETRHAQADDQGPIPPCPPYATDGIQEWVPSGAAQFVQADQQPDPPADQPNPPDPLPLPPPPGDMPPLPVCPECRAGKHPNCDGTAWDDATDAPALCDCATRGHGA